MIGPGTHLKQIFEEIDVLPIAGCRCKQLMELMDEWGPGGCKWNFMYIVTHLEEDSHRYGWGKKISVGIKLKKKYGNRMNLSNPFSILVSEAITRAESPRQGVLQ